MLSLRLVSFSTRDANVSDDDSDNCFVLPADKQFEIQMFGLDIEGKTYSVTATSFTPYFYVKVSDNWRPNDKTRLQEALYEALDTKHFQGTIVSMKLIRRNKLYGFDADAGAKFVRLDFCSEQAKNKFKNMWYVKNGEDRRLQNFQLYKDGQWEELELYEAHIPPLLRFFHVQNISPTGWIRIKKECLRKENSNATNCDHSFKTKYSNIEGNSTIQHSVPYKVMSFDIEASSSHGNFPLAIKDYTLLAREIARRPEARTVSSMIHAAFQDGDNDVSKVFYDGQISQETVHALVDKFTGTKVLINGQYQYVDALNGQDVDDSVLALNTHFSNCNFPKVKGDEVTFIGSSFYTMSGETEPYLNDMLVVGTCNDNGEVKNTRIRSCATEEEMLLSWTKLVQEENPDVVIGYNIMGFDFSFMYDRAVELGCDRKFLMLSRNRGEVCWKENWKTGKTNIAESKLVIASGQHDLRYIDMPGRLIIDLYNVYRRDYNLAKYSLNYVSSQFIGDNISNIEYIDGETTQSVIHCKNISGVQVNGFVCFERTVHSTDSHQGGAKFKITDVDQSSSTFTVTGTVAKVSKGTLRWGLAKDDVTPQDIFRLTSGTADDRYTIAKYCVKDCTLVFDLFLKTDIMTSFIEMGSLCSVPMSFLVLRGQSIKLTSYMAKKCREKSTLMPTINKGDSHEAYEGAVVLDPKQGVYLDDPVACVDYSSLYPSCMISDNISHDSKVWSKEYDLDGNLVCEVGQKREDGTYIYDGLKGYDYVDIDYDVYRWETKGLRSGLERPAGKVGPQIKVKTGSKICRYAQFPDDRLGIIPSILRECLAARKATRAQQKVETDPFMRNILDKRQLSIKITANSIYGQCGAKTSTFYDIDIAASTTALGRKLLLYARDTIEGCYKERKVVTEAVGECVVNAEYVYGDTDSVFFKFNPRTLEGEKIIGKPALELTIELAKQAGQLATTFLKSPHDLEYEKTFWPFILLSRKRYVGMLYEEDVNKCKMKAMGIVLKRRDNAPIVKDIYGGVIDILMQDRDANKASKFLSQSLDSLASGRVPIEKLILTKALRGHYKNPASIAHKVLADRIGRRDPGNKPKPGDRIEFVYVKTKKRTALQGDRIETPEFIKKQKLEIDYDHYVTNQVMKPVQQVFGLMLEDLDVFKQKHASQPTRWKASVGAARNKSALKSSVMSHEEKMRNKEVKELLFASSLAKIKRKTTGNASIMQFLKKHSGA